MYYLVQTEDTENSEIIRKANRLDHHTWLRNTTEVNVHMAGPWLDGEKMMGSVMIIECDSEEQVRAWLAKDPFNELGIVGSVKITPFTWTVNKP